MAQPTAAVRRIRCRSHSHVVKALDPLGLAYLHLLKPRSSGAGRAEVHHTNVPAAMELFRPLWRGVLITAGGFDGASAEAAIDAGTPMPSRSAASSFPIRTRRSASPGGSHSTSATARRSMGGEEVGYTDYPEAAGKEPQPSDANPPSIPSAPARFPSTLVQRPLSRRITTASVRCSFGERTHHQ